MHIHANVTISGWPTLASNSRGGGLILEINLNYIELFLRGLNENVSFHSLDVRFRYPNAEKFF